MVWPVCSARIEAVISLVSMSRLLACSTLNALPLIPVVSGLVQILSTDESLPPMQRIIKKAEKKGIYQALNIASIWLERSLKEA